MIDTKFSLEEINSSSKDNMAEFMGIEFVEVNAAFLKARMEVGPKCTQPIGILNGGASAALAETVGSLASYLSIDRTVFYTVGLEIKCNHIRSVATGFVYATAEPIHLGKRTHLWQIRIEDETNSLISLSTLTMQVMRLSESKFGSEMLMKSPLAVFAS